MPTIYSSPATFSPTQTVTFAIPSGTWVSGEFEIVGSSSGQVTGTFEYVTGGTHATVLPDPDGPFDYVNPATAAQLADINAAAGGNLSCVVDPSLGGASISVTTFILTLSPASAPPVSVVGQWAMTRIPELGGL